MQDNDNKNNDSFEEIKRKNQKFMEEGEEEKMDNEVNESKEIQIEDLKKKLNKAELSMREAQSKSESYLRQMAILQDQNMQIRNSVKKEAEMTIERNKVEMFNAIFNIREDILRAMEIFEKNASDEQIQGLRIVDKNIVKLLNNKYNIEEIEAGIGTTFDMDIHDAIGHEESENKDEKSNGQVVCKTIERGYRETKTGKILKYAKVIVSA